MTREKKTQEEGKKLKEDDNDEDNEGHRDGRSTLLRPIEKLYIDCAVAQPSSATPGPANPPGQPQETRPTLPANPPRPTLARVILSIIYSNLS